MTSTGVACVSVGVLTVLTVSLDGASTGCLTEVTGVSAILGAVGFSTFTEVAGFTVVAGVAGLDLVAGFAGVAGVAGFALVAGLAGFTLLTEFSTVGVFTDGTASLGVSVFTVVGVFWSVGVFTDVTTCAVSGACLSVGVSAETVMVSSAVESTELSSILFIFSLMCKSLYRVYLISISLILGCRGFKRDTESYIFGQDYFTLIKHDACFYWVRC